MAVLKYKDENGNWINIMGGSSSMTADKVSVSPETSLALGLSSDASVDLAIQMLNSVKTSYTCGTEDLQAGVTPLESGTLHFVYE